MMETIRLGKTGLMVTRLGFGGIPIQRLDEAGAVRVVRKCLEHGINFIDTAANYSTSEERVGRAIAGRRDGLIIATKTMQRTREGVEKELKRSLSRLGVDHIDLYQLHAVNTFDEYRQVTALGGAMEALREAYKSGLVKHVGCTSHSADVAKEAVKSGLFETLMFPLNFVACEAADELLPLCREHNVGFIAMKPIGGGMLDNAVIAVKYLLQYDDVLILAGIEKEEEIDEIAGVLAGLPGLTDAERREMEWVRKELGTRFCRRCDYCKPCPEGVPISLVMITKSFLRRMPIERLATGWFADGMKDAENCTRCGECLSKCPYGLPIPDMIEENLALFKEERERYLRKQAPRG
jgi:predicted aldo/keto reductase-like oxidoreductase